MGSSSLEKRLVALEQKVKQLSNSKRPQGDIPWWHRVSKIVTADEAFEEAMRLGREYRESLRPPQLEAKGKAKTNGHPRHGSVKSSGVRKRSAITKALKSA